MAKKALMKRDATAIAKKLDGVAAETEQSFMHNDSRVVIRYRDVLRFELATVDEHLAGLRASIVEQTLKKERLAARIGGLTRVLNRR